MSPDRNAPSLLARQIEQGTLEQTGFVKQSQFFPSKISLGDEIILLNW